MEGMRESRLKGVKRKGETCWDQGMGKEPTGSGPQLKESESTPDMGPHLGPPESTSEEERIVEGSLYLYNA